jgi:hypothetical protein
MYVHVFTYDLTLIAYPIYQRSNADMFEVIRGHEFLAS